MDAVAGEIFVRIIFLLASCALGSLLLLMSLPPWVFVTTFVVSIGALVVIGMLELRDRRRARASARHLRGKGRRHGPNA